MSKVKDKEKILKTAIEKCQVTYKGKSIRLISDFFVEILPVRRKLDEITQGLKKKLPTNNIMPSEAILKK